MMFSSCVQSLHSRSDGQCRMNHAEELSLVPREDALNPKYRARAGEMRKGIPVGCKVTIVTELLPSVRPAICSWSFVDQMKEFSFLHIREGIEFSSMPSSQQLLERAVELVHSSTRPMPAKFCEWKEKERSMSFQIDFPEITDELDYNMASHAWQLSHNVDCNNDKEKWALVFLGENLLVGTFILVRLGGEEQLPALIAEIFSQWLSQTNECHHL